VEYDEKQKRWVVDLKKNGHKLKTYLKHISKTGMLRNVWKGFNASASVLKLLN
jgi:hypothetical protein